MPSKNDRHRPGYYAEREQEDKKIRKAAKVIQWDVEKEAKAKIEREPFRFDLVGYCKRSMPNAFKNEFSQSHIDMLTKMQDIILNGGKSADAMPRGTGKTTCATAALCWALGYGHRNYAGIIGNESDAAKAILESVKMEIWLGEGFGELFPKLQTYIQAGDGQSQKIRHLLNSDQSPPLIKWMTDHIRLPTTPEEEGDDWSGAILHSCGLTGRIRGMFIPLEDGTKARPDFILIDDPQTDESARSVSQIDTRMKIINNTIGKLGGPGVKMAIFITMTVIEPNDVACQLLDLSKNPSWYARRVPMIQEWPKATDTTWQEYGMIRKRSQTESNEMLKDGFSPDEAIKFVDDKCNEFYTEHREELDEGCQVYWEHRKYDTEVSAIQHAMNQWLDDPNGFMAECQNEPISYTGGAPYILEPMDVMTATNGKKRLVVSDDALIMVTMTDINYSGLNSAVVASTNDAVRSLVDYQTFPGNGQPLYDPKNAMKKGQSDQIAIAKALDAHIPQLASARYMRNGKAVRPDLVLIDCGNWMDLVFRWCAANRHKIGVPVFPSRGRAYNKYRPSQMVGKPGDNFHVADWEKRGRVLVHNADEWRMRSQKAFLLPAGAKGSLSVFGKKPVEHKRLADEVCAEVLAEYIEATEGGNQFFKWGKKVGVANDLLDAVVGAVAGTSYLGASETGLGAVPSRQTKRKRRRVTPQIRV